MTTPIRPLRIAMMLESDGPGGAEVLILRLSEELRRRGHDVLHVGPKRGTGWLAERFRQAGFESATFDIRRALDPQCARGLEDLMRRERIDVVHSHEFTMAVYGALAARRAGVRHVVTFHGSSTMCKALRRRLAVRWAMRNSAATVACAHATHGSLVQELGVRPARIGVVQNGVPVREGDAAKIRAELGASPDDVIVLAVGNLDPRKGHIYLLRALQQLRAAGMSVPWRVVIAGGRGGPEHEGLEAFAREHGFADRLHILLRRDDIPDLQAAADVFAMPSLWEGLPMALLEAMIAGKAIVASRTFGIPEAIESGEHGLLTTPGDVGELAAALRPLLTSADERRRLGEAARRRGLAEFTVAAMADGYERLYAPAADAAPVRAARRLAHVG